jgi:diamine N-acetyltransferase
VRQIIERARSTQGIERVTVSYVDLPGSPAPFYRKLGFQETGEIDEGEVVMALELA